jgi:hypothetical protein
VAALLLLAQDSPLDILERSCVGCHHPRKKKGALDLSTREGLLSGGQTGPAVVPGRPGESLLLKLLDHEAEPFMPHKGEKLAPADRAALRAWVEAGSPYARALRSRAAEEKHWAFRPLARPELPPVKDASWARTPIDRFILARLESKGLQPAPAAEGRTLARRLSFDLLGLPPEEQETKCLVNHTNPQALEAQVDKLLASPHFGERWGRHWLDVARYADSEGYRFDNHRKNAFAYRDFVIRAVNEGLPFDMFVRWQVAGDELEPRNLLAVAATGFLAAGPVQEKQPADSPRNQERNRYDELDDMISTLGSAMLGLTLGCARCHDHKFDPIPTREYYRMLAAFIGSRRTEAYLAEEAVVAAHQKAEADYRKRVGPAQAALKAFLDEARAPIFRKKVQALKIREEDKEILLLPRDRKNQRQQELLTVHQKALAVSDAELREGLEAGARATWDRLSATVQALEKDRPAAPPQALTVTDAGPAPVKNWLLERGQVESKKEEVTLGFLSAVGDAEPRLRRPAGARTSFQRAALAEWLTDVERGAGALLARVIVNRVWQHHFGEGLVRTPNDFGSQGELPTHPELLEWLASELVRRGWRLKELHKLIVTSAVYLQGVAGEPASEKLDPDGRLLSRRRPRRLEAEALRDTILAVSGCLNREMYGPGVKVPIPAEMIITRTEGEHHYPREVADGPAVWRRSVYIFIKRSVAYPLTELFDAPPPSSSCGRRIPTTVAPQALLLLNDPFVRARARDFAARVSREAGDDRGRRLDRAFLLALGRLPTASEREAALEFLSRETLVNFCHALFLLNEFLYVD